MSAQGVLLSAALWLLSIGVHHPMHTAVIEIAYDGTTTAAGDSATVRYVTSSFTVVDRTGTRLMLRWHGFERVGDVLVLRFDAAAPAGLAGGRIATTLLSERFEDQVNIVRATYGGRTRTLLFTRGEAAKPLD